MPDDRGSVSLPEAAYLGQTIRVSLGEDWAGEPVVLWLADAVIASVTLDSSGATRVTIPGDTPFGSYELVVQDAGGNVIGWESIEIVNEPRVGPNGEMLPSTGSPVTPVLVVIGAGLLTGAALLALRKRMAARPAA